jgi:hypothetical protein
VDDLGSERDTRSSIRTGGGDTNTNTTSSLWQCMTFYISFMEYFLSIIVDNNNSNTSSNNSNAGNNNSNTSSNNIGSRNKLSSLLHDLKTKGLQKRTTHMCMNINMNANRNINANTSSIPSKSQTQSPPIPPIPSIRTQYQKFQLDQLQTLLQELKLPIQSKRQLQILYQNDYTSFQSLLPFLHQMHTNASFSTNTNTSTNTSNRHQVQVQVQ